MHDQTHADAEQDNVKALVLEPLRDPPPGNGAKHKRLECPRAAVHSELLPAAPLLAHDGGSNGEKAEGEPLLPKVLLAHQWGAEPGAATGGRPRHGAERGEEECALHCSRNALVEDGPAELWVGDELPPVHHQGRQEVHGDVDRDFLLVLPHEEEQVVQKLVLVLHDDAVRRPALLDVLQAGGDEPVPVTRGWAEGVPTVVLDHLPERLDHPLWLPAVLVQELAVRPRQGLRLQQPGVQDLCARQAHDEDVRVPHLERGGDRSKQLGRRPPRPAEEEPQRSQSDVDRDGVLGVLPAKEAYGRPRDRARYQSPPLAGLLLPHNT
mmetsp:Transcript_4322/g.15169  ORF Transcript_4322/g.15169 Transcript_4322/m.15169 type:complete len:323 (+) Transcript_4322:220-1188(+)